METMKERDEGIMTKRILLVDDAAFMRKVFKDILVRQGHEVVGEAENGLVAVERYKALSPDVVLMDITMPLMTGIEATAAIKAIDSKARVIICSAMGQQDMVLDSMKAGAIDFLVKPVSEERIQDALSRLK